MPNINNFLQLYIIFKKILTPLVAMRASDHLCHSEDL